MYHTQIYRYFVCLHGWFCLFAAKLVFFVSILWRPVIYSVPGTACRFVESTPG